MKFLVYSEVNAETIASSLGLSEYSYYFVLREFLPVLRELGEVLVVKDPRREVDRLYRQARRAGEPCVFLSFTPPHKTSLGLRCPTIPVMAWEFDTIPSEHWFGERAQDWRYGLRRCGRSITHSGLTVRAIQAEMGADYPVVSIPAPVWDKYGPLRSRLAMQARRERLTLKVHGVLLDSHAPSFSEHLPARDVLLSTVAFMRNPRGADSKAAALPTVREESLLRITYRYAIEWYRLVGRELFADWRELAKQRLLGRPPAVTSAPTLPLQPPRWQPADHSLELSGVVFTALFNPNDGRKNWNDMLTAFCTAFRDCDDATLVFKLGSTDYESAISEMLICMARLPKFACRVVFISGFLDGEDFEALIEATQFVVNASYGEGQCLPLMEFLSCGRPAVAPRNSAMLDYIDEEVGFVVDGWLEIRAWPQDPRGAYRTCQQQIDWASLVTAYSAAYDCFKHHPERYLQLSHNAVQRMDNHCSRRVAEERLRNFLNLNEARSQ